MARYIKTKRGAQLLLFSNYVFRQQSKPNKDGLKNWYCVMYYTTQCKTILTTDLQEHIVQIRGDHNHKAPHITSTPEGTIYKHAKKKRKRYKSVNIKDDTESGEELVDDEVQILP